MPIRAGRVLQASSTSSGMATLLDRFFGFLGLLADIVGDFGQVAFVGADGWQVFGLTDQVDRSQSLPYLFRARVDHGALIAGRDICTRRYNRADSAGNRGPDLPRLRGAID